MRVVGKKLVSCKIDVGGAVGQFDPTLRQRTMIYRAQLLEVRSSIRRTIARHERKLGDVSEHNCMHFSHLKYLFEKKMTPPPSTTKDLELGGVNLSPRQTMFSFAAPLKAACARPERDCYICPGTRHRCRFVVWIDQRYTARVLRPARQLRLGNGPPAP